MDKIYTLFIHGRAQEFKDRHRLRREWLGALNSGLTLAGSQPLPDDETVKMPFYGDKLYEITKSVIDRNSKIHLEALDADNRLPEPESKQINPEIGGAGGQIQRELIGEITQAYKARLSTRIGTGDNTDNTLHFESIDGLQDVLSWTWARQALSWLSHHTRLDQAIISAYLKDVAVYLLYGRKQILDLVRSEVPKDGLLIIISHSLGAIVARELLNTPSISKRTLLWVTAGSPLGLEAVQNNMKPRGVKSPPVQRWISTWDVNDIVAAGSPIAATWTGHISEYIVENGPQPHSIERYLGHLEVGKAVGEVLNPAT